MVSHRKHKTVGAHLLTNILPNRPLRETFLMIAIKSWEFEAGSSKHLIASHISSFHVIHERLIYHSISASRGVITCKVPVACIGWTGLMQ